METTNGSSSKDNFEKVSANWLFPGLVTKLTYKGIENLEVSVRASVASAITLADYIKGSEKAKDRWKIRLCRRATICKRKYKWNIYVR